MNKISYPMKKYIFILAIVGIQLSVVAQNVGISDVLFTPQSPLHIDRTSNGNMLQLTNPTTTNAAGRGLLINGTGLNFSIRNFENGYLSFLTNNTERMIILSTGFVGINSATPTANFHVNGTVRFQGLTSPSGNTTALVIDATGNVQARTLDAVAFVGYTETDPNAWLLLGNNDAPAPTNGIGIPITTGNFMGTTDAVDVAFGTNGYERMRIKSNPNGNTIRVGIGTAYATPYPPSNTTTLLHVYDAETGASDFGQVQIGAAKTTAENKIGEISFHSAVNTSDRRTACIESYITNVTTVPNQSGDLRFSTNQNISPVGMAERMRITSNGNVGIGTTNPTYKLHVVGRFKSDGINETSDVRLKKNILPIDNALDKILALQGVTYEWNKEEMEKGIQIGLIAQEVEKILPEIVNTDSEGFKSIQYSVLVAVLIEAVKEQQADYDALLLKVEQMESDMAAIKAMIGVGEISVSK